MVATRSTQLSLTASQRRKIIRLYLGEYLSIRAVANKVGCSHSTVYRSLTAANIPLRPRGSRQQPRPAATYHQRVQIHGLDSPDQIATVVTTLTRELAASAVLWPFSPHPRDHNDVARSYLRDLCSQPEHVTTRIASHDGKIVAAAWWTTCTTGEPPGIDLTLPGRLHHRPHRTLLDRQLRHRHPTDAHQHLLAVITTRPLRRRRIGTALITDSGLGNTLQPRYLLLPEPGTALAARLGCSPAATPLPVTNTVTLHPWLLPTTQLPATRSTVNRN